jgi:hypothetical protein
MNSVAGMQTPSLVLHDAPALQNLGAAQLEPSFNPVMIDVHDPIASRDIESFFDELASLDGAERLNSHPQFMQNLGFAPDANLADLLTSDSGQYNTITSPYLQQNTNDPSSLGQGHLFDGG